MIQQNELRIGNFTEQGKVKSFYEYGVHVGMGKAYTFDVLKPKKLTDEALKAFGATKEKFKYIYDRFAIAWMPDYGYWYVIDKEEKTYLTKIEFIHEWQNFIFAMNGEELTLKSK